MWVKLLPIRDWLKCDCVGTLPFSTSLVGLSGEQTYVVIATDPATSSSNTLTFTATIASESLHIYVCTLFLMLSSNFEGQ